MIREQKNYWMKIENWVKQNAFDQNGKIVVKRTLQRWYCV